MGAWQRGIDALDFPLSGAYEKHGSQASLVDPTSTEVMSGVQRLSSNGLCRRQSSTHVGSVQIKLPFEAILVSAPLWEAVCS